MKEPHYFTIQTADGYTGAYETREAAEHARRLQFGIRATAHEIVRVQGTPRRSESTPHNTAAELNSTAAELVSLATFARSNRRRDLVDPGAERFGEHVHELAAALERAGMVKTAAELDDLATGKPWRRTAAGLERIAGNVRRRALELRQTANDDDRRAAEGDEQRDYAEERYNAAALVDEMAELETEAGFNQATDDPEPIGIGAALTLDQLTADELESYAKTTPALVPAVLRELVARVRQLERLAEIALGPMMHAETMAGNRVERMKRRPAGSHSAEKIADAELEHRAAGVAAAILREHSTSRRRIVRRLEAGK